MITQQQQIEIPNIPRILVLEQEDLATSGNPLTAALQRKGWRIPVIDMHLAAIHEKQTPDMFTGETEPLTQMEKILLEDIAEIKERTNQ